MKHVVALSGGKDSTAMALELAEREPRDYVYVCTPTGNEPEAIAESITGEVCYGVVFNPSKNAKGPEVPGQS